MVNAIQLYDKNAKPLDFWICGQCRMVTLNPLYSFGSDKEPRSTREAAEKCCTDPICEMCNQPYKKTSHRSRQLCDPCDALYWQERNAKRLQSKIDMATEVPYESGMVFCEGVGANDGWFSSIDELIEHLHEYHLDDETGEPLEWPEWCFAATPETRVLYVKDAIDEYLSRLSEDGYEDMDIRPSKELIAAAEKFNEEHSREMTCWNVDYSRKIRIVKSECTS